MKFLLSLGFIFASSFTWANVKNEIRSFSHLTYKNDIFTVKYTVSGGCEKHATQIELETVPGSADPLFGEITLKVRVYDVTHKEDQCKSLVHMSSISNLEPLIVKYLKFHYPDVYEKFWKIKIILPNELKDFGYYSADPDFKY